MRSVLFAFGILLKAGFACTKSTLLSGGTIIAFDASTESLRVIRDGSVLVTGDRIAGLFDTKSPSVAKGTKVVDVTGKIISPGFVDTHKHGWQTAFKTLGSNTTLPEYFLRYGEYVTVGLLTPDDVYLGQLTGLYEAINSGTTTTLDHAHHTWSNATAVAGLQACIDSGARVFWAYQFHNVTNYTVEDQLPNFRDIATNASFKGTPTSLAIGFDIVGAQPPNLNENKAIMDLALEFNISAFTAHYVGGPWGGTNSPTVIHGLGLLNISIPWVLSHASFLTPNDGLLLRSTNQYISMTPESEMHYGHLHPDSHLIQDQASLGVDTHFTFSGDILTQVRLWLQTTRYRLYEEVAKHWAVPGKSPMSVDQAFLLATRKGGLALRRNDIGIIAEGAKADLVVWDGDSPALLGWRDPIAAIVLHASVGDITSVMVDGKWLKKDGKLTDRNYDSIRSRFITSARRIQDDLINKPLPPQDGFFMSGFPLEQPFIVDTQRGNGDGYGQYFF